LFFHIIPDKHDSQSAEQERFTGRTGTPPSAQQERFIGRTGTGHPNNYLICRMNSSVFSTVTL